ncbi:MAG: hypothetical protein L6R38_009197 [Xanthoria sp. 2 TBL-2021]|nr:MAG: hypothetical protein L6R38_009197 [Xanthoria sp. 2 TBL-2021]
METAGVGLAIVGTCELCLKYGKRLRDTYRTYRDAETGFAERLLILENRWLKVEVQLRFLHDVWSALPGRFQLHFNSILAVINTKLIAANDLCNQSIEKQDQQQDYLHALLTKGKLRRGAFAVTLKNQIDGVIRDLDQWQQNLLDPTWYQLVLVPGLQVQQTVDRSISESDGPEHTLAGLRYLLSNMDKVDNPTTDVFLPYDSVEPMASGVEYSKATLGIDNTSREIVLLDRIQIAAGTNREQSVSDVYHLVQFFSSIDPELFGFLRCLGALKNDKHCDLVFRFPEKHDDPTSLRGLLLQADKSFPLNARLNIAQMLARSCMFLHDCQFVHKSLRPENIVCFSTQGKYPDKPYMIGLDRFRQIDARSMRSNDDLWYKDIYRHPSRQGIRPEKDYIMQHDIYSLGVCLLEIGLWRSFLEWEDGSDSPSPNEEYISNKSLGIKDPRKRAHELKRALTGHAEQRLPGAMGQVYTSTVIACLTCLDPGNTNFGDHEDLREETGILVGLRFVEKILMQLLAIAV